MLFFLLFLVTIIGGADASGAWGYGDTTSEAYGPADWGHVSKICSDGKHQSPVDINTDDSDNDSDDDANLELSLSYDEEVDGFSEGTFKNNGHSPTFAIMKGGATLRNPINDKFYRLAQFHFHFGCQDNVGSEHTIKGKPYPGELHLVFYNTDHADVTIAANKPDGLTVIGVFLKKDKSANLELKKIAKQVEKIEAEGAEVSDAKVSLRTLLPDKLRYGTHDFYSYKGSLTTPGCYESVSWLVLENPLKADDQVFASFRKLESKHGKHHGKMCDNFRPTQHLNGRVVTSHSTDDDDD
uniref:Carbonic anhydrase n=1 Tax=Exaiptasia diaphana TaxID=2652724 RepID=A0A1B0Y443_EXADI|nr:alpha carbonic anhydrase 1 [Exaiptasia diaphana]